MAWDRDKLGNVFDVANENPHPLSNPNYMTFLVDRGGDLIPLMFTEREMMVGIQRAQKNPEDTAVLEE